MKVDAREILFIRQNAPKGMMRVLADNIGLPYSRVRAEIHTLKEDYPDNLVNEARRLLLAMKGLEYTDQQLTA